MPRLALFVLLALTVLAPASLAIAQQRLVCPPEAYFNAIKMPPNTQEACWKAMPGGRGILHGPMRIVAPSGQVLYEAEYRDGKELPKSAPPTPAPATAQSGSAAQVADATGGQVIAISRTIEGFTLGASTPEVMQILRRGWGAEYRELVLEGYDRAKLVAGRNWWVGGPAGTRGPAGTLIRTPAQFGMSVRVPPQCGPAKYVDIGTTGVFFSSATAKIIRLRFFQDRLFEISVDPQAERKLYDALTSKYGPPKRKERRGILESYFWEDPETSLSFEEDASGYAASYEDRALSAALTAAWEKEKRLWDDDEARCRNSMPKGY